MECQGERKIVPSDEGGMERHGQEHVLYSTNEGGPSGLPSELCQCVHIDRGVCGGNEYQRVRMCACVCAYEGVCVLWKSRVHGGDNGCPVPAKEETKERAPFSASP